MRRIRARSFLSSLLVIGAVALGPRRAAAQITDTLPQDTARVDTTSTTARYLAGQRNNAVLLPILPRLGVEGPRPAQTRLVFDRDSLEWLGAATIADVLQRVPGVYLWRGGWTGQPAPANYQGRGATAVEYELDGLPYVPVGPDSVGVDPALLAPSLFERVEVERWPGLLRVHLFTRRHDRLAPRSWIGASRGDVKLAAYQAALERRFRSGLGFSLVGDYLDVPPQTGAGGHYRNTQFLAQAGWIRPTFGVQLQLVRMRPERDAFVSGALLDSATVGLNGTRTDAQLRGTYTPRGAGAGPRLDLLYGRTGWSDTTGLDQHVSQGGAVLTWRAPAVSLTASAFNRSRWTPWDLRAGAAWSPSIVSARIEAIAQSHDGGRHSRTVGVQAGLALPLGLQLTGSGRFGRVVAAPAVRSSPEQSISDLQALVGIDRPWVSLQGGWSRTDAFVPHRFTTYLTIDSLRPVPRTDWLTARARLAPLSWLSVDGWYETPRSSAGIDGLPPRHLVAEATLRSRFLRAFPSGVFDLQLRLGLERWGAGTIGLDGTGAPITLDAATFWRSHVQLALGDFIAYWDRVNLSATSATYVPGFRIPGYANTFGLSWAFVN